jgi:hypothetical protein
MNHNAGANARTRDMQALRRCFDEAAAGKGVVSIMNTNSQDQSDAGAHEHVAFDIRHLSAEQLGVLGVSHIAYVKPIVLNGEHGFAIHAADGTPMAVAGDRDVAIAAILQHEMQPLSVH